MNYLHRRGTATGDLHALQTGRPLHCSHRRTVLTYFAKRELFQRLRPRNVVDRLVEVNTEEEVLQLPCHTARPKGRLTSPATKATPLPASEKPLRGGVISKPFRGALAHRQVQRRHAPARLTVLKRRKLELGRRHVPPLPVGSLVRNDGEYIQNSSWVCEDTNAP